MLYVGNDVVDLNLKEIADKYRDARFVRRVFTPLEQQIIQTSKNSNRMLWILWASKETAYKIISKKNDGTPFVHKRFQIKSVTGNSPSTVLTQVHYQNQRINVKVRCSKQSLHATGVITAKTEPSVEYYYSAVKYPKVAKAFNESNFSPLERESIRSSESMWVRHYAKKDLSRRLGIPFAALTILRRRASNKWAAPEVYVNHVRAPIDISLSHHGRWVAWAWSFSPNRADSETWMSSHNCKRPKMQIA